MADTPLPELIEAAKAGDPAAQDALLSRYRNYLTYLARMSVGRELQAKLDASDVVQDALLKAHRGLDGFVGRTEEELVAWLRQILARTLSNANRTFRWQAGRRVDREVSIEALVSHSSQALGRLPAANGTSPSRGAERREAGALVADMLSALKADDREVILLRSLEERDWGDVAERMGRSVEAVRALWGRAIQHLGAQVEARR
jgi:RNA polymerase sigma-70 factor (ECF subfamily)